MSQVCEISKCERTSRALCDCCKQKVCLQHLQEHNTAIVSQLSPLADEINTLGERLNMLNLDKTASDSREKLEKWRVDCHKKIDAIFEEKCRELHRLFTIKIDEERKNILYVQTKLAKLIREQEATRQDIDALTSNIRQLDKEMNKIEQSRIEVNIRPLLIDDSIIQFESIFQREFHQSIFSSVYNSIMSTQDSSSAMTSNGRLLLINHAPNLCFLNRELTIVKEVLWPYEFIVDMCWSSTLNRFIVIGKENVSLVDENTMSIENAKIPKKQNWLSGTCFNDELFLSTNVPDSSIVKVRLSPSITVFQRWNSPKTCKMNEIIDAIRYNNGTLAVVIRNGAEKTMRMELRCCKTLDHLWSVFMDVVYNKDTVFRFCSLDDSGWLVADYSAGHFLHITTDGKMKQTIKYKELPCRIVMFGSNMLVVATKNNMNFHKF